MIEGKTVACLGGTFNRLHAGHRLLISTAFQTADRVVVGVSSDALVRRLRGGNATAVRPFPQREADVRRLLTPFGADRFEIISLDDPYIPAHRPEFDAIVVTPDTLERAEEINALRDLHGMASLKIVSIGLVPAFDGKPISSTRILAGEIDEEGKPVRGAEPPPAPSPAPTAAPAPAPAPAPKAAPRPKMKAKPKAKKAAPKAGKKRATGKKGAKKPAAARSKARKGSRASGPRRRR